MFIDELLNTQYLSNTSSSAYHRMMNEDPSELVKEIPPDMRGWALETLFREWQARESLYILHIQEQDRELWKLVDALNKIASGQSYESVKDGIQDILDDYAEDDEADSDD